MKAGLGWPSFRILAAISIWALHFGILYGATAFACEHGATRALPWVIGATTVAAVSAALALIVRAVRGGQPHGAAEWAGVAAAAIALAAILWQASPLMWTSRCA